MVMSNHHFKNILQLNLAVLFISTSGTFGRYINMPAPLIILLRSLLGGIFIYLFCKWNKLSLTVELEDLPRILISGFLLGAHWTTYFIALKLSSVAIGMLSLYTYPVLTTFLEPLILKTKFQQSNLLLGLLVLIGIYFLVPSFDVQNNHTVAILFGIGSAICYSLRNIILKPRVHLYNGSVILFYQTLVVSIVLLPLFIVYKDVDYLKQLPAIVLLALLTTALGHSLLLSSLKNFSITSMSLLSSIQPIYGIIIGIIFLKEYPPLSAIIGGSLILSSVIIEGFRKN